MRGPPRHGWIYFIRRADGEGPIKIGISSTPYRRLSILNWHSPDELTIVAKIEGPAALERRFHNRFRSVHVGSEWFEAVPDLLAIIEAVDAGIFDTSTLPAPFNLIESLRPSRKPWTEEQRKRHREGAQHRAALRRARVAQQFPKPRSRKVASA